MESFDGLKLSEGLSRAVSELGFTKPSPIQAQALPLLLGAKTDFLGMAATGTGKTAAFGIPLLERINQSNRAVQAIVLCPTRELALQVAEQLGKLGRYKGIEALAIYGGTGFGDQVRGLKRGVQIVVATPGRLIDHLERKTIALTQAETVVLDEADEMISMGFKDDLEIILKSTSGASRNIWLFAATMSPEIRRVADKYMRDPKLAQVNKSAMLSGTVQQIYYVTKEANKADVLCKLIDAAEDFYGLIFCQTKSLVVDLTELLRSRGYKVDCLHGDMDQSARERTMGMFKARRLSILVCTDVASRGLHVNDVTHVVNYSIPRELESYVHRIGRTGRSGKAGIALSLVTHSHMDLIGRIEKMTRSKMVQGTIPSRKDIGSKKLSQYLSRFNASPGYKRAVELLGPDWTSTLEKMEKSEIAARFLAITFEELFAEREKEKHQLPQQQKRREPDGERRSFEGGRRKGRFFGKGKGKGAGKRF